MRKRKFMPVIAGAYMCPMPDDYYDAEDDIYVFIQNPASEVKEITASTDEAIVLETCKRILEGTVSDNLKELLLKVIEQCKSK